MQQMQTEGVYNYIRFNLSGPLNPMQLTGPGIAAPPTGLQFGDFNQQAIDKIDTLWSLTDVYGLHAWTVFWHRGGNKDLRQTWTPPAGASAADVAVFDAQWDHSPFNANNVDGNLGPIEHQSETITNLAVRDYFEAYIRLMVARWGWRPNWLARELCAESYLWEQVAEGDAAIMESWQNHLLAYFKTVDPYSQLITSGDGKGAAVQAPTETDFFNAHIHPPNLAKLEYEEGLDGVPYGAFNHADFYNDDATSTGQLSHVDLSAKTYINGSLGYGHFINEIVNQGDDNEECAYKVLRTAADRHAYWENLFMGATGVGCAWDTHGALAEHGAPALYAPVFHFANAQNVPSENFTAVRTLPTSTVQTHAMAMHNSTRSLVYLFNLTNGCFLTSSIDIAAECAATDDVIPSPLPSCTTMSASTEVPVEFTGGALVSVYDTDDTTTALSATAATVGSCSDSDLGSNCVMVNLAAIDRAVAISITSL